MSYHLYADTPAETLALIRETVEHRMTRDQHTANTKEGSARRRNEYAARAQALRDLLALLDGTAIHPKAEMQNFKTLADITKRPG